MAAQGQPAGPSVEHGREPCPDRILDDMGSAFGMGAVGGGIFHFLKAVKNSPRNQRTRGGIEVIDPLLQIPPIKNISYCQVHFHREAALFNLMPPMKSSQTRAANEATDLSKKRVNPIPSSRLIGPSSEVPSEIVVLSLITFGSKCSIPKARVRPDSWLS